MSSCIKMATGRGMLLLLATLCASTCMTHAGLAVHRAVIPHNAFTGYVVKSLHYWGQKLHVDYSHQKDISKHFIVTSNGDLITNSDISHLLNQQFTLAVTNTIAGEKWTDTIHVSVQDGNKMLLFSEQQYKGHVFENKPAGSVVSGLHDIHARISDTPCAVHYALVNGDPEHLFSLHKKDVQGVDHVQIRTNAPLDHEEKSLYSLVIKAWTDDSKIYPAFAKINMFVDDENDNIPKFEISEYHADITTDTPPMTTVLKVRAMDRDSGELKYTMDQSSVFEIDSKTGSVILKSRSKLEPKTYTLFAHAYDSGGRKSERVTIHINVKENPLYFHPQVVQHSRKRRSIRTMKTVEVPETMTGKLFSVPRQDSRERYSFKQPAPKMLRINPYTALVSLIPGKKLDYEEMPEIDFVVIITRSDIPTAFDEQPIKIKLSDVNDELPYFINVPKPFLATVKENAPPGISVYHLMARDADKNSQIRYNMESGIAGGEDRFEVDPRSGIVRTIGFGPFDPGREYEIGVSASDMSASVNNSQKSRTHSLKILVGERDPQFFETQYRASVPESAQPGFRIVEVKALSHQRRTLRYELKTASGGQSSNFAIDPNKGIVDLLRQLDYETDPSEYHLIVKAIENGRISRTSSVSLIIALEDVNDHTPVFPLSQYIVTGIAETVAVGSDIMQVTATDRDSSSNAGLTYTVSNANFSVNSLNNIGYITTARRLDYDYVPGHTYNFTVLAKDNGVPQRTASAMVQVTVTNVNDEAPTFLQAVEHVQVNEDTQPPKIVHVVQAYDADGDNIIFSFRDGGTSSGPFVIDPRAGIIKLVRPLQKSQVSYMLNITATDDGACCGGVGQRSSRGTVIVEVKDVNNNAPRFDDCDSYNPTVMENSNTGTSVIQISAADDDTGSNGNITYSIVNFQDALKFTIEPITGILRTAEVFDREDTTDYGVTVKAEDQGKPRLAGFCSFRVKIGDINDQAPIFDSVRYSTSIEESSIVGTRIIQVYATDKDIGENGEVEYYMKNDNSGFFAVHPYTGWISVKRAMSGTQDVELEIEARDRGSPEIKFTTVKVDIGITQTMNAYPKWMENYENRVYKVKENADVNTVVASLSAISPVKPDQPINYKVQQGSTPQTNKPRSFYERIVDETNSLDVLVYKPLDYETIKEYILTVRASNRAVNSLSNDTRIKIQVIDVNDEIPQFVGLRDDGRYTGSVPENSREGTTVLRVTATDRDEYSEYKAISYSIKPNSPHYANFSIHPQTGIITTNNRFDREKENEYYITVVAKDGAPSNRPNHQPEGSPNSAEAEVQIRITDQNDNAPSFRYRVYPAVIPENVDVGTRIIHVTAEDKDEDNRLTYSITKGNKGNVFQVIPETGEIKVARPLDYEAGPREYKLEYRVFDEKYASIAIVEVKVTDVNDNPPRFLETVYHVNNIVEEDRIGLPKSIIKVQATDPDTDRSSNIRYALSGQFAEDGYFNIDSVTGEIKILKPLDRDRPNGRPVWNFNVLAYDEPGTDQVLTGYAEVRVMPSDINDNFPVFDRNRLRGKVLENAGKDVSVMTVKADDADVGENATVMYTIKEQQSPALFKINPDNGLISTTMDNALDRESIDQYTIVVQATDRGYPKKSSTATVTINIADVNDNPPQFQQKIYRATMSESYPIGASVTSVKATDKDSGINAQLVYNLKEEDRHFFSMSSVTATNTGVLKVFNLVDYDNGQRFFNLTVYVQNLEDNQRDFAFIEVTVKDYNDNAPTLQPSSMKLNKREDIAPGSHLGQFTATDKDEGKNKEFRFAIDRSTDPDRLFAIGEDGIVRVAKPLDREKVEQHRITIQAIDKGEPSKTGTGQLILTLSDVNDNFPVFAENYMPVVPENTKPPLDVIMLYAKDHDRPENGGPFRFWLPCSGNCPCPSNPTCEDFGFDFIKNGGPNGDGSGKVYTKNIFDREESKYYLMPIVMEDSGYPSVSGTNTLTIIIGDQNDNQHFPGHKTVHVYNYKGWDSQFENAPLGNVYAEDKDDWDRGDKLFVFVQPEKEAEQLFLLDKDTGELSMKGGLKEGEYNLEVHVYDKVHRKTVTSTVTVIVTEIGEEAVRSSGSVRLTDTTAEEFVEKPKSGAAPNDYGKSKYDLFRETMAKKLGVPTGNVDIFTVRNHPTLKRTVDIRYAAHGSPYYRPSKLDGVFDENRAEFEKIGLKIAMVPVDECLKEVCESGGCSNDLHISNEPLLINTNGTSLVGVMSYVEAECVCAARRIDEALETCSDAYCLNGGTCVQQQSGIRCECHPEFDGPRCQQTKHGFKGNGWAWYEPLSQCEDSHTSFEFVTQKPNGLLLYNGPQRDLLPDDPMDFVLVELRDGYPVVRVNHGTGEVHLTVTGRDNSGEERLAPLHDGQWHRIDIYRKGRMVKMVVDHCKVARVNEDSQSSYADFSACQAEGETAGENKYVNVNTPLQLGGRKETNIRYPENVMPDGFNGCIRNFMHDGWLYDLHTGRVGLQQNTEDGCQREDLVCKANSIVGSVCGEKGICDGGFIEGRFKCVCKPGYRGPKCDIATTVKDFREKSYIEWSFRYDFYGELQKKPYETDIQMMFRTRQSFGILLSTANLHKSEYMIIEIQDDKLQLRYNLGSDLGIGAQILRLKHVNVSDGLWHTLYVKRYGREVSLSMDSQEGRYYVEQIATSATHLLYMPSQRQLYGGADVKVTVMDEYVLDSDLKDSCVTDLRYNGQWFPMEKGENMDSMAAQVDASQNLEPGCPSAACVNHLCNIPFVCVDLWRMADCQCPVGQRYIGEPEYCEAINECTSNPCVYGECEDRVNGFYCMCQDGWKGTQCNFQEAAVVAALSTGAIIAILISTLVVLLVVLLFILYSRRRRPESYAVVVDPDDDVRENIINYDEEGVGEEDQDAYDINRLKKPIDVDSLHKPLIEDIAPVPQRAKPLKSFAPGEQPDIGDFINDRLKDAEDDRNNPPHDSVREYAYEGGGSDAGSLSSLASSADSNEQDFDYLNNWGPRFTKLADMYGAGTPEGE